MRGNGRKIGFVDWLIGEFLEVGGEGSGECGGRKVAERLWDGTSRHRSILAAKLAVVAIMALLGHN